MSLASWLLSDIPMSASVRRIARHAREQGTVYVFLNAGRIFLRGDCDVSHSDDLLRGVKWNEGEESIRDLLEAELKAERAKGRTPA